MNTTADRAVEILLMFSDDRPAISVADVSAALGMPRSTTYRYLAGLRAKGVLADAGGGTFRLGARILDLARIARRGFPILGPAEAPLRSLVAELDETVLLVAIDNARLTVIERIDGSRPPQISLSRGQILPDPASASAKLAVAYGDKRVRATLRRRAAGAGLRFDQAWIAAIRERGYAVNRGEADAGISAVAAPILDGDGLIRFCVSIVAPTERLDDDRLAALGDRAVRAAAELSGS